jgi:hypothetical protein
LEDAVEHPLHGGQGGHSRQAPRDGDILQKDPAPFRQQAEGGAAFELVRAPD